MSERGLETVNIFNDIISLVIKSIEKDGGKDTQADAARVAAEQERSRRQAAEAEAARLQAEKDAAEEARHLDQWGGPGHP